MKNIKLYLEDGNELELETCFLTDLPGLGLKFFIIPVRVHEYDGMSHVHMWTCGHVHM